MKTYPLTQTQLGIYLSEIAAEGQGDYNINLVYYLDSDIDTNRLVKALQDAVNRHPYIKSRLTQDEQGEWWVEEHSDAAVQVDMVQATSKEEVLQQVSRPFNLLHEPLYRLAIYTLPDGSRMVNIDFHHILCDGMSTMNFHKEVSALYDGCTLPEPIERYGFEVAQSEYQQRQESDLTEVKSWYATTYGAATDIDSMPLPDQTSKDTGLWHTDFIPIQVDKAALEACCEHSQLGISMPFIAAFGYLLSNYTANEEVLFTTIYHGREKNHLDAMGMFVKTLPVYMRFSKAEGSMENATLMQTLQTQIRGARKRTIYSFAEVCQDLDLHPRICFAYQANLHMYHLILGGKEQQSEEVRRHRPGLDMIVNLIQVEEDYQIKIEYDTTAYTSPFIQEFCLSYEQVLRDLLTTQKIADISLVNAQQTAVLDGFNTHPIVQTAPNTVIGLFEEMATTCPDHIAVVYEDKQLTYQQVNAQSERIARVLAAYLPQEGERVVAILVGRSENMVLCALAAQKAGAAYQPLDPSYPQDRLAFMVQDSGAQVLLCDQDLAELINPFNGKKVMVQEIDQEVNQCPEINQASSNLTPDSLFILLYTSGSTGTPKGVMLRQHNLVTFCDWYKRYYHVDAHSRVLAYASFGFDANMMDLYGALTNGATVVIAPETMRLDLDALSLYMADKGVTHSFMTTQVGYQFACNFPTHPTLKHLTIGGEKMASIEPPTSYRLYNGYGPTECTIFSTIYPVTQYESNIPIGRPLDTMEGYIVNPFGHRLPWGAAGELIIIGNQVGHGYLNQPDKTRQVFITANGQRAYKSGDIVRYRANGNIEFVGRRDGQVKIRGFRIELKEVEAVIRQYEGIKDCTVQAYDLEGGGKYLAAYIVSKGKVDIQALHAFIAAQKPPYMVPTITMQIEAIPLNVNQKVDKKKLPQPTAQNLKTDDTVHALNVLEKRLVEMVHSLTGQEPIIGDPLVYYGLSSILGMRLSVMLYKQFGIKITGKDLLGTTTILDIENAILSHLLQASTPTVAQQDSNDSQAPFPLTFAQQGVYADCMMNPNTTVYNIPMDITLPLSVDEKKLRAAIEQVLSLHPMLFAQFFENEEGDTMQRVCVEPIHCDIVQTDNLEAIKRDFVHPFDLKKDRLFRCQIVKMPRALHVLLDVHHLVCDGGSEDIILRQVLAVLRGEEIAPETCSYTRFATQQRIQDQQGQTDYHKTYFDTLLQEMEEMTEVPGDRKGEAGNLREVYAPLPHYDMPHEQWNEASFWLAAASYTIGRYAGTKHIYMTTVSNGRQDPEVAETVGMFVNTLPVTTHIGNQSVREYVQTTHRMFRDTISHENYPFARIAADYGYNANITYAYQLGIIANNTINGQEVQIASFGLDTPKFKLGIFVEMYHGVPSLVLQYDDAVYSASRMEQLRDSILMAAERFMQQLERPVRTISIMTAMQQQTVERFSYTADQSVDIPTFHAGISRWAKTRPDAIAVIACDRTLTYREYEHAANAMAHALMHQGVVKGDRIVLLLPRTSDFLVSVLAVMKCGAAFIPMDPQYPADRIAYILSDSNGRFVLTTQEHLADYPDRALDIDELKKGPSNHDIQVDVNGDDLAYLIYTSGSTGKPKGVMLQHKGICNYLTAHPANPHTYAVATEAKAVLCSATVSFDLSILEYGTALFNGKTVVFANEQATTDSKLLAQLYTATGADVLSGTPSRIEAYLEMDEYQDVVRRCKVIQMGGEKLPDSLMKRLQAMTKAKIFNMYGPTEITICCNADQVNDSDQVTVGKPLPNFSEYIVDPDLNELPVGVSGELLVCGVGVCPGYNNLPDKTQEAFISWHRSTTPQSPLRAYRTGDIAQWTPDGKVIILGRTDHQVKLNGLRIELGEIETVMAQQTGVKKCVIQVRKVGSQDKLVAYYVGTQEADETAIKAGMAAHLTHYMVPSVFMRLEQFPITPAGKIDMRHLPEPHIEVQGDYVAPQTAAEKDFCDIFAHVLKIERVGATDDFFALGGTSLVAIKVVIAAEKKGYQVTYSDIFANPTPQSLATFVSVEDTTTSTKPLPTEEEVIPVSNTDDFTPLLKGNTMKAFLSGERQPLGTVMLTGATGYLGIHVLYRLLMETDCTVICPIRSKDGIQPEERLRTLLVYYFSSTFESLWGNRLIVMEGEVTQREWMNTVQVKADTVINCLANVKHFSTSNDIEFVNVESVRNLVVWCCKTGTRLVHISTTSVAGRSVNNHPDPSHLYSEQEFEIGQVLDNRYAKAKYDAEKLILDAILHHGLNGKILRVGNLSARQSDGEFQANFQSNNFMATLRAYQTVGVCPYALLDTPCEFSPIDEVADAVLKLATTPIACVVFHPTNPHLQLMGDVLKEVQIGGKAIQPVERDEFDCIVSKAMDDEQLADRLRPLMAYNQKGNTRPQSIHATNAYTTQVLHRLGFSWSVTSWDYVRQFIQAIDGLGYFD